MKNLYRKGTVHPTSPNPIISENHLAFLPAAIFTLTVALSPEDRQVLAYLISCSSENHPGNRKNTQKSTVAASTNSFSSGDHPPSFNCDCFNCYMSYWARWDSSPDRQLIHEVIDAYEEGLMAAQSKKGKGKKDRRKRGCNSSATGSNELRRTEPIKDESEAGEGTNSSTSGNGEGGGEDEFEKGSIRTFVSFLGEKIWSVWC